MITKTFAPIFPRFCAKFSAAIYLTTVKVDTLPFTTAREGAHE